MFEANGIGDGGTVPQVEIGATRQRK
jgi:hypothetical protein